MAVLAVVNSSNFLKPNLVITEYHFVLFSTIYDGELQAHKREGARIMTPRVSLMLL